MTPEDRKSEAVRATLLAGGSSPAQWFVEQRDLWRDSHPWAASAYDQPNDNCIIYMWQSEPADPPTSYSWQPET